jgi:hypothetical protein
MVLADRAVQSEIGILIAIALVALISGLLVARRSDHPISWLLSAAALAGGIAGLAAGLLPPGLTDPTWWQSVLAIVSGPAWYALLLTVLVLIPLLFPTGSPLSPRWGWVGWLVGAAGAVLSILWMLQEEFCTDWQAETCTSVVPNPIGIRGITNPEESTIGGVVLFLLLAGAIAALLSLVVRFRRSGPVERQQVKWVAFSVGLFIGFTVLIDVVWVELLGRSEPPGYGLVQQSLWVAIPASIGIAILRYRLYDIDLVINRTLVYGSLTVALAGVYGAGVVLVPRLLPLTEDNDLVVAGSTLAVAALFSPLRRRIQAFVDRRFYRSRYDARRTVEAYSARLREEVDLEELTSDLVGVVRETLQPASVSVWLKEPASRGAAR